MARRLLLWQKTQTIHRVFFFLGICAVFSRRHQHKQRLLYWGTGGKVWALLYLLAAVVSRNTSPKGQTFIWSCSMLRVRIQQRDWNGFYISAAEKQPGMVCRIRTNPSPLLPPSHPFQELSASWWTLPEKRRNQLQEEKGGSNHLQSNKIRGSVHQVPCLLVGQRTSFLRADLSFFYIHARGINVCNYSFFLSLSLSVNCRSFVHSIC